MSTRVPITTLLAIQQRARISHAEAARALGVVIATWSIWRERGIPAARFEAARRALLLHVTCCPDTATRICDGARLPDPIEPGRYVVAECIAARRRAVPVRVGRRVPADALAQMAADAWIGVLATARIIGVTPQTWQDWRANGIPAGRVEAATAAIERAARRSA